MTRYDVAAYLIAHPEGSFDVHRVVLAQAANVGPGQRFTNDIELHGAPLNSSHGQASAVDRNGSAEGNPFCQLVQLQRQPTQAGFVPNIDDLSELLNNAREHVFLKKKAGKYRPDSVCRLLSGRSDRGLELLSTIAFVVEVSDPLRADALIAVVLYTT